MKRPLILLSLAASLIVGCSAGNTPVETVEVKSENVQQDSMQGAIENNPNLPPAAKNAILGGKK